MLAVLLALYAPTLEGDFSRCCVHQSLGGTAYAVQPPLFFPLLLEKTSIVWVKYLDRWTIEPMLDAAQEPGFRDRFTGNVALFDFDFK